MGYKPTLQLPKTSFPMKADLPNREPAILKRWQEEDLYGRMRRAPHPRGAFVLHDGPPYANGDIHIGHALNKILKDLILRYKTLQGFDCPYVPGWDCHGMPIEHQLFKELKLTKHQIDQRAFRTKARAYAERYVGIQREQFKRLGVLGDWDHPYLTMATEYELTILRVFKELVRSGYIYRGKKPVYWCATCETALAEAEVEYEDRTDTSIFVAFPIIGTPPFAHERDWWDDVSVAVWTTTPWTLPANVAVCLHPDARYALVVTEDSSRQQRKLVLLEGLIDHVLTACGVKLLKTLQQFSGKDLATRHGDSWTLRCRRPAGDGESVGVTDASVHLEEGTGVVHIAPGHGYEDYAIGQRHKLEVLSPVDHQGRFTKEVPQYAGLTVWEATPQIVADLKKRGLLLAEEPITHSYPHCWRCKEPVIFRATPQWFLGIEQQGLRQRLLESVKSVRWVPPAGLNRISGMLESRPDWCLSRQRYWGTPIPVLHCARCDQPITDVKVIEEIERTLAERGLEAWFTLPPSQLAPSARCPQCQGQELKPDADILDVWFDSGVSHEAVLRPRGLGWPAALYLEGSDQHRGWFQVSLITAVALHGAGPYEQVLTHGFVMDGQGRKMSKSLGNVVAPQDVLTRYGADVLRLWVASCDYREDVRISEEILAQVAESYRKIRNTFRYLLANLYDYEPPRDPRDVADYPELDRWALHRTGLVLQSIAEAYEAYQFHEVTRLAYQFCVLDLSAFYLDALKDRLYTEAPAGNPRRCAQAVLYAILQGLVRVLAPILVTTTEEVWQTMRETGLASEPSVHLAAWPTGTGFRLDEQGEQRWATFLAIRDAVMKALEEQRSQNVIGAPLDARVTLVVKDRELLELCRAARDVLAEAFVVSQVDVEEATSPGTTGAPRVPGLAGVLVARAPGRKCARCWKYGGNVGREPAHPELCARCAHVVMGAQATRR